MAEHTTLKRDGGWTVELIQPIHDGDKITAVIDIRPAQLNDVIAWGEKRIFSVLGMLSLMSNAPEAALRSLQYPDVNRVMKAFYEVLPQEMRDPVFAAPMSTPLEQMNPEQQASEVAADLDPVDPRFPRAEGHVWRMPKEIAGVPPAEATPTGTGFAVDMPDIVKRAS